MPLPADFQFSQSSLQDFVECPRRFQLRHIERRAWPAAPSEPVLEQERHMIQGMAFHRMVQQYWMGVPEERLSCLAQDEPLRQWWSNYRRCGPKVSNGKAFVEFSLAAAIQGYRLVAKYDLVLANPDGGVTIYDWKTARRRTRREALSAHLQTRVYRYLMARAGGRFNSGEILPAESIRMVYWFAGFPEDPETFGYSPAQHAADGAYLSDLVEEIAGMSAGGEFPAGARETACLYCVYRSLCGRGVRAGSFSEIEDELPGEIGSGLDFDFDQIAEIAF